MTNVLLAIIAAGTVVMAAESIVFAAVRLRERLERRREIRELAGKMLSARKIAAERMGVDPEDVPIPEAKVITGDFPTMDETERG